MYTDDYIDTLVKLYRQALPELRSVADEYDGKLKVLNAILEDLDSEKKTIMEYKEEQIADCEANLLGDTSGAASKDAERIMELICDKFKIQNRRLEELEEIEQKLHGEKRPVERILNAISKYMESMSEVVPLVSDERQAAEVTDNNE